MDGINTVLLVGKIHSVTNTKDKFYITIVISNNDGDLTIPIHINKQIYKAMKSCYKENDLIGIKGTISVDDNELCIIASKISILSKRD